MDESQGPFKALVFHSTRPISLFKEGVVLCVDWQNYSKTMTPVLVRVLIDAKLNRYSSLFECITQLHCPESDTKLKLLTADHESV